MRKTKKVLFVLFFIQINKKVTTQPYRNITRKRKRKKGNQRKKHRQKTRRKTKTKKRASKTTMVFCKITTKTEQNKKEYR
jgi:hypothetical protein